MMSHKWFNPEFPDAEQAFEGDDREEDVGDNFLLNEEDGKWSRLEKLNMIYLFKKLK